MPVVDFHLHCYDRPLRAPESFIAFMDRELAKAYGSFAKFLEQYGSAESYLRVLDDAGADYGVILAELAPITSAIDSNETVEALCKGQPRLIPFASLNPYLIENPARELERLVRDRGFRGLKLYDGQGRAGGVGARATGRRHRRALRQELLARVSRRRSRESALGPQAGPKPTDVVRSFAMSGRNRTGRPTASFSSGMSTIRPRIETPSLSRTTATA